MLFVIPGRNLVIAGMCNLQGTNVGRILDAVVKVLLADGKP